MSLPIGEMSSDYRAAKEGLAHRIRAAAVLDIEGQDRVAFLQGQLTQDVTSLSPGQVRPTAALTPNGKLLYIARLQALPDRLRLLFSASFRARVLQHLKKYAAFQEVNVVDRSDELSRVGLYGPQARSVGEPPAGASLLAGEGEFAAELIAPAAARMSIEEWLRARGSAAVSERTAEALRIESGRPRLGQDADGSHLADEVGLEAAISRTKGCYVGQEIVARLQTYGRLNRRLVGWRFPQGGIPAGSRLNLPQEAEPGKIEQGRVTSSAVSPAFGAIGIGYAFRDVPVGGQLVWAEDSSLSAIVAELPFA